jgi:phage I-like protein
MSTAPRIALMSALALPEADGTVPDWIMVLPPPGRVETQDDRGPYSYTDPEAVVRASMAAGRDLPIDINHSIDLRGPKGEEAPARGWIKELQARADGIWARVEWTREGAALLADRAYRFISPVLGIDAKDGKTVRSILRASLVNRPNLRGLPALNHQETTSMTFMERLAEKLGQPKDATEDELLAAIPAATNTALQSALAEIGAALGVEDGDPAAILLAAKGTKAGASTVAALQAQVATLQGQIAALEQARARTAAEAWLADQLKAHVIPADQHETLITLHMEKPDLAARVAAAWPAPGPGHTAARPPKAAGTITSLNAEQRAVAAALGIPEAKFLETLKQEEAH